MTPRFNLVDEPWIPCSLVGETTVRELGLRDVLLRAPAIREVADPSPLITVALHRLLLAVLHSALRGPADVEVWRGHWERAAWDTVLIEDYLARWHDRFDLFEAARPFFQVASLRSHTPEPIARLMQERASSAN